MLRLGLSSFRPLVGPTVARTARSTVHTNIRTFTNFRPSILQKHQSLFKSKFWFPRARYSRDVPLVEPAKPINWGRAALIVGGVAGTVVVIEAALNRETRDALSLPERSLLNESFTYTGAGLVITAVAARAMFTSGVAYRIRATNPWVVLGASLAGLYAHLIPERVWAQTTPNYILPALMPKLLYPGMFPSQTYLFATMAVLCMPLTSHLSALFRPEPITITKASV
ncbi:hypothetical protein C8J57DRAFT_1550143 [Mycena rebaudengoi]|nr:hypothetical protein C8J57DRAFT_1550143 [Mycena rebaudengoi]